MAIQMPQRKPGALERLAQGLTIANQGVGTLANAYGIYRGVKEAGVKDDEREKALAQEAEEKNPDSEKSVLFQTALEGQLGIKLPKKMSYREASGTYGGVADYVKSKFQKDLEHKNKLAEIEAQGRETRRTALAQADRDRNKNPNKFAFDQLPIENQKQIENLAGKVATKKAIRDQLEATWKTLGDPSIPYEQKFMAAKNLGKTLNSTEGADAVGEGEAERMLSFLNHLPTGRPGWDIGPQLEKFTDQVAIKVNDIDKAIFSTKSEIENLYGRGSPQSYANQPLQIKTPGSGQDGFINEAQANQRPKFTDEDLSLFQEAKARVKANPNDRAAKEALSIFQGKGLR